MNILLLTTMYPDPLRPATKVCHYFARQWRAMGHEILVVNYRSMFPPIFTFAARLFPRVAQRYVGNHVEMDRNMDIVHHEVEGIPVYSIPIFKYIPHGPYPQKSIRKQLKLLLGIMSGVNFTPDVVIGHFYNPQIELVARLKELFPQSHTCVTLHEPDTSCIRRVWPKNCELLLSSIDTIGFRSLPIKRNFELNFGEGHRWFHCCSGTPAEYLVAPQTKQRVFNDGSIHKFIYVGQFIKRKYPVVVAEALMRAYPDNDFHLTYVGKKELLYDEVHEYTIENGLQNQVSFTGQVQREDIINYYDSADCFIMVSKSEVFGLVYLEAMARGCITIAARHEGLDGIIETGKNGFLCEAGNADELTSIIKRINSLSADEKRQISENARHTAEELSDFNVAKRYLEAVMNN